MTNPDHAAPLPVHIVLNEDNKRWIIEKIALKLQYHTAEFGICATLGDVPRANVAVNHWTSYASANVFHVTPATMFITHIDDPYKLSLVKDELTHGVDIGVCMSSCMVAELVSRGVDGASLCYVSPAHDGNVVPRRIVVGLTTRLYPDGRKREELLLRVARTIRLDAFRFDIFGTGWRKVVPVLEAAGAEVRYFPGTADYQADYLEMIAAIPNFDYYMYLGLDEGSLGTLDALSAGVKTIITPQGFHVDLPGGITRPVWTLEELLQTFRDIASERQARIDAVSTLTWREYARQHATIWQAVAEGKKQRIPDLLARLQPGPATISRLSSLRFYLRYFNPIRVRSWLSHIPMLKPLRAWIKLRQR